MSRYTLVDTISEGRAQRKPIPLPFRIKLFEAHDSKCAACGGAFATRLLQADHRIPFEVGGDAETFLIEDFMPLCGSDNRAKSMSCETCPNWEVRDPSTCSTCYWHDPDNYVHLAEKEERRINFTVQGADASVVEELLAKALAAGQNQQAYILQVLRKGLS